MANGTGNGTTQSSTPRTLRGALINVDSKIVLAFFLTTIAALMVIVLLAVLVNAPEGKLDAGTIALIASMIMLFIKMAADAAGYQTQSSAGSDKKDDTSATVQRALADRVPTPPLAVVLKPEPWWGKLKNGEPAAITAAAASDPRVMAFITASNIGAATPDDLAYLETKGLLTPERAAEIQKP